jgi:FkbM family methyltransferase
MILRLRPLLILMCKIPGVFSLVVNPLLRKSESLDGLSVRTKLRGCIFHLNLSDYTQRKAWLKTFEAREIKFLQDWLRQGDTAVDVGANIGLLTVPMSKGCGERGQVFAFEPIEENVSSLMSNLRVNELHNVAVTNCAVGNFDGHIRLSNEHHTSDQSTGFFHRIKDVKSGVEVVQIRLDLHLTKIQRIDEVIRLMKIDVEGMELEVLEGLGDLLNPQKISAVMFEVFVTPSGMAEPSFEAVRKVTNSGYTVHTISKRGTLKKENFDSNKVSARRSTAVNLVAVSNQIDVSSFSRV